MKKYEFEWNHGKGKCPSMNIYNKAKKFLEDKHNIHLVGYGYWWASPTSTFIVEWDGKLNKRRIARTVIRVFKKLLYEDAPDVYR